MTPLQSVVLAPLVNHPVPKKRAVLEVDPSVPGNDMILLGISVSFWMASCRIIL